MMQQAIARLRPYKSALFLCDVQEAFKRHIFGFSYVVETARQMASVEFLKVHGHVSCKASSISDIRPAAHLYMVVH